MAGRAFSFLAVAAVMALSLLAALPSAEARCTATDCPTCIKDIGCYWFDDACNDGNPEEREDVVGHGEICPAPVSSPDTPFPGDDQRGTLSLERENDQLPILTLHHSGHHGHSHSHSHSHDHDHDHGITSHLQTLPAELVVMFMQYLTCPYDVFNLAAACTDLEGPIRAVTQGSLGTVRLTCFKGVGVESVPHGHRNSRLRRLRLSPDSGKAFEITFEGLPKMIMIRFDFGLQLWDLRSNLPKLGPTALEVLFAMPVDKALATIKDYMAGGEKFVKALELTLSKYSQSEEDAEKILEIVPRDAEFPLTLELSPNWGDDTIALPKGSRSYHQQQNFPESQSSHPPAFTQVGGNPHELQITARRYIKLMKDGQVCIIIVVDPAAKHAYVLLSANCIQHFLQSSCGEKGKEPK